MYNIIYNPRSGGGKKRRVYARVIQRLDALHAEYRVFETEKEKQALWLTRELTSEGPCDVIVVGGDGTLHEVLNGFTDFENCRLGLIPAGTGNDFAAAAKIPVDPDAALDLILQGEPKPTDFMQMDGVRGINVIGTGIDVEILKRCRASKILRGKFQYVISLIISLIKFKNYKMRTVCNGEEHEYKTLIACIGNGRQIGGGIRMCPEAVLDDGLLDFVVVDDVKKSRVPAAFVKLMKGKILEEKFTRFVRTDRVEVFPEKKLTVQVDGELYDDLPFRVQIVKGKLMMYRG
ncbi:MAG TPA: diacylglycerol kinase family lipid kinase [Candidatus Borkfalkia excrementavium]|uniref:Diacylglycerol kinase family lipid kinase n=1 Tax=Candidatus Borkfalkia excrementavium TaxID=2838505 RepID=A0A9D1Z7Z8_9FIRM|nr:diacylglycerol kinase family lipid kinase [Candidatus Borkfalkia excrementavium]